MRNCDMRRVTKVTNHPVIDNIKQESILENKSLIVGLNQTTQQIQLVKC
jgi:hypothetical protein